MDATRSLLAKPDDFWTCRTPDLSRQQPRIRLRQSLRHANLVEALATIPNPSLLAGAGSTCRVSWILQGSEYPAVYLRIRRCIVLLPDRQKPWRMAGVLESRFWGTLEPRSFVPVPLRKQPKRVSAPPAPPVLSGIQRPVTELEA